MAKDTSKHPHETEPPWRGQLVRPMPGGGWQRAEVCVPASELQRVVEGKPSQTDTRQLIMGAVENFYTSVVLGARWVRK